MATGLLGEIHRRFLWQTLLLYGAGAAVALWLLGRLAQSVDLPSLLLLAGQGLILLGLPVVLLTAAVQGGMVRPDERALRAAATPGDIQNERAFARQSPRHVRGAVVVRLLSWGRVVRTGLWLAAAWGVAVAAWLWLGRGG